MKKLLATSNGFKEFELFNENHQLLGRIIYPKWYYYDVEIKTMNSASEMKLEGFWNSKMLHYSPSGNVLREIEYTWNGFVIRENSGNIYFLSGRGFWDYHFDLKNELNEELMLIKPIFSWKIFKSEYEIEIADHFNADAELILAILHAVNYRMMLTLSSAT